MTNIICGYSKMRFNFAQISNTPIKLQEHEIIHDRIRKHLLQNILPKIFMQMADECKKHECYPVIIGGTVISHCATLNPIASSFINDLFSEDVDIKFVVNKPIANNNNPTIKAIDRIRLKYLRRLIKLTKSFISAQKFHTIGWTVDIKFSDYLLNIGIEHIRRKRVYEAIVSYVRTNDQLKTIELPIIDMGLYSVYSISQFNQYRTLFPGVTKLPIPYIVHDGIMYADCNYAYYDTIRMMIDRGEYFKEKKTLFALLKLSRYIIKFLALYILLKNKRFKTQVNPEVHIMYRKAHKTLKAIDLTQIADNSADIKTIRYDTPYVSSILIIIKRAIKAGKIEDLAKAIASIKQGDA